MPGGGWKQSCGTPAGMEQNCVGFLRECSLAMRQQRFVFKSLKDVCCDLTDTVLSLN